MGLLGGFSYGVITQKAPGAKKLPPSSRAYSPEGSCISPHPEPENAPYMPCKNILGRKKTTLDGTRPPLAEGVS